MSEDDLIVSDDDEAPDSTPSSTAVAPAKGKTPVAYSYAVAEAILVAIAEGKTLTTISKTAGMPARNTIYKWLTQYPKFFDAYERAKEVSAQSLEDEALTIARNLSGTNDYTGTKVTALNYAMQQLRWSAARRDPARYGQKADTNTTVPITINTTLNLGQDGMPAPSDTQQNIYTVEAVVEHRPQPGYASTPDADDSDPPLDLEPVVDDNGETVFGAAVDEKPDLKEPKRRGRPPGRKQGPRKSPAMAKMTATKYSKKDK